MNRIARYGLGFLGVGLTGTALSYGIGYAMVYGEPAINDLNNRTVACAQQLGTAAVESAKLAPQCEDFSEQFPQKVTYIVNKTDGQSSSETRIYSLPSKQAFIDHNFVTKIKETEAMNILAKESLCMGVATGGTVGLMAGFVIGVYRRQLSDSPQDADPQDAR